LDEWSLDGGDVRPVGCGFFGAVGGGNEEGIGLGFWHGDGRDVWARAVRVRLCMGRVRAEGIVRDGGWFFPWGGEWVVPARLGLG